MASEHETPEDNEGRRRDISPKVSEPPGTDKESQEKLKKKLADPKEQEDGTTDVTKQF